MASGAREPHTLLRLGLAMQLCRPAGCLAQGASKEEVAEEILQNTSLIGFLYRNYCALLDIGSQFLRLKGPNVNSGGFAIKVSSP